MNVGICFTLPNALTVPPSRKFRLVRKVSKTECIAIIINGELNGLTQRIIFKNKLKVHIIKNK